MPLCCGRVTWISEESNRQQISGKLQAEKELQFYLWKNAKLLFSRGSLFIRRGRRNLRRGRALRQVQVQLRGWAGIQFLRGW